MWRRTHRTHRAGQGLKSTTLACRPEKDRRGRARAKGGASQPSAELETNLETWEGPKREGLGERKRRARSPKAIRGQGDEKSLETTSRSTGSDWPLRCTGARLRWIMTHLVSRASRFPVALSLLFRVEQYARPRAPFQPAPGISPPVLLGWLTLCVSHWGALYELIGFCWRAGVYRICPALLSSRQWTTALLVVTISLPRGCRSSRC